MQGVELDLPFSQFVEIYFRDKEPSLKARTVINKRYTINSHVLPFFGEKRMNEILPSDVIKWQNEMQKKGFAETYLRMIRNQLTAIFTHATRVYDLRRNPCSKVKKMGKRDAEGIDFWTVDEYRQFIAQFEPGSMYHTLFEVLFWTGTRIGEALAITKADIDLEKKQLNISKTYYRLKGEHVMARPKTENSIRSIELPMFLIREITGFTNQLYKLPDNERIFRISAEAVQHMMKRRTKKQFKKLKKLIVKSGLPKGVKVKRATV